MTLQELRQLMITYNSPEVSKLPGMVYQVWEDGEITLQKSGDLLWMRTLHCMNSGFKHCLPLDIMPVVDGTHGYIWCENKQDAEFIRGEINRYFHEQYPDKPIEQQQQQQQQNKGV